MIDANIENKSHRRIAQNITRTLSSSHICFLPFSFAERNGQTGNKSNTCTC